MARQPNIGEILVRAGVIDEYQLRSALGEQKRWGRRLGTTLLKMGFVEEPDLVRALAEQLGLPVAQLEGKRIQQRVLDLVPGDFAQKHLVLPLFVKRESGGDTLYVGMEDPGNLEVFDDLCFRTGMRVKPVMVTPSELCEAIDRCYRGVGVGPFEQLASESPQARSPESAASQAADGAALELEEEEEFTFVDDVPGFQAAAQTPGPESANADSASRIEASNRVILRALTQILIEKELVGRDEFYSRVRQLQDAEEGSRTK